jgi:hypothetical protein
MKSHFNILGLLLFFVTLILCLYCINRFNKEHRVRNVTTTWPDRVPDNLQMVLSIDHNSAQRPINLNGNPLSCQLTITNISNTPQTIAWHQKLIDPIWIRFHAPNGMVINGSKFSSIHSWISDEKTTTLQPGESVTEMYPSVFLFAKSKQDNLPAGRYQIRACFQHRNNVEESNVLDVDFSPN